MGMVDRLTKAEYLERIAADLAMGRKPIKRERRGLAKWLVDRNPIARAVIRSQARKGVDAKAHGNYPAPTRRSTSSWRPGPFAPRSHPRGGRRGRRARHRRSARASWASSSPRGGQEAGEVRGRPEPRAGPAPPWWAAGSWGRYRELDGRQEGRGAPRRPEPRRPRRRDVAAPQGHRQEAQAPAPLHGSGQRRHGPARGLRRHQRSGRGRHRHRGGGRGDEGQARGARRARRRDARGRDPGHQHLVALRHGDAASPARPRARRRHALLQPCEEDAPRRDRARGGDLRRDHHQDRGARRGPGQDARRDEGRAGFPGEPAAGALPRRGRSPLRRRGESGAHRPAARRVRDAHGALHLARRGRLRHRGSRGGLAPRGVRRAHDALRCAGRDDLPRTPRQEVGQGVLRPHGEAQEGPGAAGHGGPPSLPAQHPRHAHVGPRHRRPHRARDGGGGRARLRGARRGDGRRVRPATVFGTASRPSAAACSATRTRSEQPGCCRC